MWLLIIIGGLLGFGLVVDMWYKKKGIQQIDPEENAKHVSNSERIYTESYMHNMKNDFNSHGGGF
ncbi:hypothetical protein [Neobacillus mesonae]|uniref:hypothetical protein n=1 Tax=Neobacillus mesonae TaxID=1193713 RepID=UPI002574040D|nr:hypothetical protein [Neobacillus mesonae]MED4205040.1 hypothetical protein [Neobacillus mesonae]